MTAFRFRAARPDGEIVHGSVDAGTGAAALDVVSARGLLALEVVESATVSPRAVRPSADLAEALSGLAALLDAGLPADRALAAAAQSATPRLAAALEAACARVREGASMSSAMEAAAAVPPLVLGLVRAGERSGKLAAAVARAAAEVEREVEMRARLKAALTYPAFVAAAGTVSVIAIAGFVVPRFAALLDGQGRALPAATRALLTTSHAMATAGPALLLVAVAAAVFLAHWSRTDSGTIALHRRLLDLPLLGPLRHRFASARVCTALGGLLEAGVPMLAALGQARDAAGDRAVAERLATVRAEVERGEPLSAALKRHRALSPGAQRLTAFGESSGRLAVFLSHAARLEAAAAQRAVQRAVTLLEPILILIFGAIVAFVATALFQAVYSVRPGAV